MSIIERAARYERHNRIIAETLAEGYTRRQVAERLGLPYLTVTQRTMHLGGKNAERRKAAPAAIIAAARTAPNLKTVALAFGISRERVRQLVVKHERDTGEHIPRSKRHDPARYPLKRVTLTCPDCGVVREMAPSIAKLRDSERCRSCAFRHIKGGRLTMAVIEDAIAGSLAGRSWMSMALALGYSENASFNLPRSVFTQLLRQGRAADIAALWPNGIPHWLRRYERATKVPRGTGDPAR